VPGAGVPLGQQTTGSDRVAGEVAGLFGRLPVRLSGRVEAQAVEDLERLSADFWRSGLADPYEDVEGARRR
jgi:hypothetical protein